MRVGQADDIMAERLHGLGQQHPLGLLHDAALEGLRRVVLAHLHGLLPQDAPSVGNFVDQVYRRARHLDPVRQRGLMHAQAVIALAAEGGNQRGMHVDDALGKAAEKVFAQDGQKSRQHHRVDAVAREQGKRFPLEGGAPAGQREGVDARGPGALERIGVLAVGQHQHDVGVGHVRVQQRLQVGAAPRNEHGDAGFQHSATPSSPGSTRPQT